MDRARKLLSPEREALILRELLENGRSVAELSAKLGVSEATVRRDLFSLEVQGKLRRVHGGVLLERFPRAEPVFDEKASLNSAVKKAIAARAVELVADGDSVYLDGGSTVLGLARLLYGRRDLTITTNSLAATEVLMETGHRLFLVGGEFRPLSRTLVGPLTAATINTLRIDKAFMGTIGFTLEDGISTTDPNEAYTKELVMRRSAKVVLLADSGKLDSPSFAVSGGVKDIDVLVTDSGFPRAAAAKLKKMGIELLTAE